VTTISAAEPSRRDFLLVATASVAAVGAAATLVPLIAQMNPDASTIAAGAPVDVDLAHLWTQLGVKTDGGTITFDDGAPLAAIRRAITDRHAPPRSASALDCDGDGVRNPSGPS